MQLTKTIRIAALFAATAMMLLTLFLVFSVTTWGSEWFGRLSPIQQYWIPKLTLAVTLLAPVIGVWLRRRQRNSDQKPR